MSVIKKSASTIHKPSSKKVIHLTIGEKLTQRALSYSEKTGLSMPEILRNSLDLLLKQNNF